jgi:hypothetical protein
VTSNFAEMIFIQDLPRNLYNVDLQRQNFVASLKCFSFEQMLLKIIKNLDELELLHLLKVVL